MITRRHFLRVAALGSAGLGAGCGFHPIYARNAPARVALGAVYVNLIPNRNGQLLRQALQGRLEGTDDAIAKRYTLAIAYSENVQVVNVQIDNSVTRLRTVGTATWTLAPVDNAYAKLAGGTARSVDGFNIADEQFFYEDLSEDAAEHRLADALADQIVIGLSLYFDKNPGKA
jgi:LPS-assembly lipoprotein